jgi:glucose/arabinose dehydrogenase
MRRSLLVAVLGLVLAGCGGRDDPAAIATPAPARVAAPKVSTVATGLEAPWEIAFLPDGRALITERPGRVRLLSREGKLRAEPVATVRVDAVGESGLLGLAVDPEFARNRLVYLYRTVASGNEIARYELRGNALREQAVIADGIRSGPIHDGGRLRFGPDDRLYFSTGDTGDEALARDPHGLNGKLLRLDPAQYRTGSRSRPEIVSTGHRNPQGFGWQPGTGRFVEDEHGPDGDDEVNLIRPGADYGWPLIRGHQERDGLVSPIAVFRDSIAPSGATFVTHPGSTWTGDYLMACLVGTRIQRVTISDDGRVTRNVAVFDQEFGRLRSIVEGPDGALYVLTNNTDGRGEPRPGDDRVLRIVPPPG